MALVHIFKNTHTHTYIYIYIYIYAHILHVVIYCILMFAGPCIIIYFYSKTNQMHNISNLFLFWNSTLHVSDSLSVHHQESKTVHIPDAVCTVLDS